MGIVLLNSSVGHIEFLLEFHPTFQDFLAFGFAYLTNKKAKRPAAKFG